MEEVKKDSFARRLQGLLVDLEHATRDKDQWDLKEIEYYWEMNGGKDYTHTDDPTKVSIGHMINYYTAGGHKHLAQKQMAEAVLRILKLIEQELGYGE